MPRARSRRGWRCARAARKASRSRGRPSGFDAGALYEVTYTARDPVLLGMGFAAVRDVVSFLRRDGSAANPLAPGGRSLVRNAIGFGVSQSGRFLRDYLYLGFNQDLAGGMVFDGLMPHVAGGRRMALNYRFGMAGRNPDTRRTRHGRPTCSPSPTTRCKTR
jgi:hypothetical protein